MVDEKTQEFTDAIKPSENKEVVGKDLLENANELVNALGRDVEKRYIELVKDNARKDEFNIGGVIWKRRKIKHKEFKELIKIRKELNNIDSQKDSDLWESKHEEFYKAFANLSLVKKDGGTQMTGDDYDEAEAGEIERIIDGINFRISYGIPSAV